MEYCLKQHNIKQSPLFVIEDKYILKLNMSLAGHLIGYIIKL